VDTANSDYFAGQFFTIVNQAGEKSKAQLHRCWQDEKLQWLVVTSFGDW
jgi:hypothetical protein